MRRPSAGAKRILVVEDEPAIRDICQRVLADEGFKVSTAANGKIGQGMIERKRYDFCLIDMRTPKMNGRELYQWLKEKHLPLTKGVIFTTGDVMDGGTLRFLEQAAKPLLPKPFTPGELRTVAQEALKEIGG